MVGETLCQDLGLVLLFLSCWTTMVATSDGSSLSNSEELDQELHFHLKEVQRLLGKSDKSGHIRKRSADLQRHCDSLVTSAEQMCSKIKLLHSNYNTNPKSRSVVAKVTVSDFNPENDIVLPDLTFYSNSTPPEIILYKAQAKRHGATVEVKFEIIHSSGFVITRVDSFDHQIRYVESPESTINNSSGSLEVSTVWLKLDASSCRKSQKDAKILIMPSNNARYKINTDVDICNFDKPEDEEDNLSSVHSSRIAQNDSETSPATQANLGDFGVPKLKVLSDPSDTIMIQKPENPFIDIEINLNADSTYNFYYKLWDWREHKFVAGFDAAFMSREDGTYIQFLRDLTVPLGGVTNEEFLLSYKVLNATFVNSTTTDDDGDDQGDYDDVIDDDRPSGEVRMKLRITVNIGGPRELSGLLVVGSDWRVEAWKARRIISVVTSERVLSLQLPYKFSALPQNVVEMKTKSRNCDTDNSYAYPGVNCTIECSAWGANIKTIIIIKSRPYIPPIRMTSYVIKDTTAFVIQDLGPPHADQEGSYRCTVVFENGKSQTRTILLP